MEISNHVRAMCQQAEAEFKACRTREQCIVVYKKWQTVFGEQHADKQILRRLAATFYEQFNFAPEKYVNDGSLPTAPIGETVQWYPGATKRSVQAAIVVGHSTPGCVHLAVVAFPGKQTQYVEGVFHHSHPIHKIPNPQSRDKGSWDYIPGRAVPAADLEWGSHQADNKAKLQQQHFAKQEKDRQLEEARKAARQASAKDPKNARPGDFQEPQNV